MKKIILFCLLLLVQAYPQSGYTVELKKTYCQWVSPENWITEVETVLKYNGSPIPNSNNYYYEYHLNTGGTPAVHSGYGLNTNASDGTANQVQSWYVIVTDVVNHTFTNLTSGTVYFQMETVNAKAKKIIFRALRSDGSTLSTVTSDHWMYPVGLWGNYSSFLTVDYDEVLRSSPDLVTATNDKFNYWNADQSLVLNHNNFYITTSTDSNLTANYKTSNGGITIQNNIDGFTGDSVEFMDPWLVDYTDLYGTRNQGMSAPFKKVASPFNPSLTSSYKGVFLNQDYNIPGTPYYSVQAPLTPTVNGSTAFFSGWRVSPSGSATLQYPNNSTTAVVFNSDSAAVTANYSYSTISTNTTLNAGTYNIAGTLTVPAGVTLTVNTGAALNFHYNTGLVINGTLVTNGGTFTSYPTEGSWKGITLNSSNGSAIQYATISKALAPIIVNNTSSINITGCTINSSSFYDGTSYAAAIQISNSSPAIYDTHIEGQSNSSNGVRFYGSSNGTLRGCTIQNLGGATE